MTYKGKVTLRYYIYITLIIWGSYFLLWLIGSFIAWDLGNPFAWVPEVPTMEDEGRMAILFGFACVVAVKWIIIHEKVKKKMKEIKKTDVFQNID